MLLTSKTTSKRYEVKKSLFISYLTPIKEFKSLLKDLKKEHPKASHIIYAYRTLNEYEQIVENSSDDGEPKGCAGAPTLAVLRGDNIIESAVITVRYFGGVKLGTGGMIRAYTNACQEVIKSSKLETYEKKFLVTFDIPYSLNNRYEHFFNSEKISYLDRKFETNSILWSLHLTKDDIERFEKFKRSL